MIRIDSTLRPADLLPAIDRLFEASAVKILTLHERWDRSSGAPVFTVNGKYTTRGWTEWTQGFQHGAALLQFEATGDERFLELGRTAVLRDMATHVSHVGVHDHGFNNVSTYGALLRMMNDGTVAENEWERVIYELALKTSGAVQAARWTALEGDAGFIHSFNGRHSLFADTIRSLRSLAIAHALGHRLMGENDTSINLLHRLLRHAEATARYNVYFGDGRDIYDVRGRVAHESIFNTADGRYRCPSSQQGYSPFSTWTRGLAWILCGFAEQLEFLETLADDEFPGNFDKSAALRRFQEAATATADFYIDQTPVDGVPYWDTGAPGLAKLGDYLERPADPFNDHEPVDSSAACIAAQGLLRLGRFLRKRDAAAAERYWQAGLTVARTVFNPPYLSTEAEHEGLILHSVYHRPNGWDFIPPGRRTPCGEASMWGDYHARELALLLRREAMGGQWLMFFTAARGSR